MTPASPQQNIVSYQVRLALLYIAHTLASVSTGLDPGTLYEFRLVARNSVGTGAVSGIQSYHTRSGKILRVNVLVVSFKVNYKNYYNVYHNRSIVHAITYKHVHVHRNGRPSVLGLFFIIFHELCHGR